MSRDTTPYEVFIDERVEKDLERVPKHVVEKFLKLLDELRGSVTFFSETESLTQIGVHVR